MEHPRRVRLIRDQWSPLFGIEDVERGTWLGGWLTERGRALAIAERGYEVEEWYAPHQKQQRSGS